MKKLIYILLSFLTLSCSPQRQLARLLDKHPELKDVDTLVFKDTVIINDTIYLQFEKDSVSISLDDILKMDSLQTKDYNKDTNKETTKEQQKTIETAHSGATLKARGNGKFLLKTYTKPDTIVIHDTVYKANPVLIPKLTTQTKTIEKVVYKMHWWEKILFYFGQISSLILLSFIAFKIIFRK